MYSQLDAQRAWALRRADRQMISAVDVVLADVERRATELVLRTLVFMTDANDD